ncbi:MAG: hypothetical protein AAFO57_01090, partial [Pseudomonadota bacterium]
TLDAADFLFDAPPAASASATQVAVGSDTFDFTSLGRALAPRGEVMDTQVLLSASEAGNTVEAAGRDSRLDWDASFELNHFDNDDGGWGLA